jgi:CheY-like chemotaxis protein
MFPERILVVDDDPLVPSIARAHFLTNGVSVCDIASNGRHALELFLASESTYDLIVCDISMPEVDGIELISALHHQGLYRLARRHYLATPHTRPHRTEHCTKLWNAPRRRRPQAA